MQHTLLPSAMQPFCPHQCPAEMQNTISFLAMHTYLLQPCRTPPCSLITPPSAIFPPPSPQPCCLHPFLSKLLTHHPHLGRQKQSKILCNNLPFISEAEDIHIKHSTQLNGVLNTKNIGNL